MEGEKILDFDDESTEKEREKNDISSTLSSIESVEMQRKRNDIVEKMWGDYINFNRN